MLISVAAYALLWGWQFAAGFVVLCSCTSSATCSRREAGLPVGADVHPVPRGADRAQGAAGQRLERGQGGDRRPDPRRARRGGGLGARRVPRLGSPRRAGVHRLLPQPLQPGAGLAARRRPDRGRDPPVALVRRPDPAARHHNHRPEPDHAADPLPRRARVLAPLAEPPPPRGEAYYRVTPTHRWVTGVSYIVLAALLALGMAGTFVERDI